MKTKKARAFYCFFWRRVSKKKNGVKWGIRYKAKYLVVDSIHILVPITTHNRKGNPRSVIKGKGVIRFEYYKEDWLKKIRAIIE